jgi:hypothetical protein
MEEVRMNHMPAALRCAVAMPDRVAGAVDAIVVRDLFPGMNSPEREYETPAVDRFDIRVRIAGMINMAFRALHQNYLASFQVVTVARILTGPEGMGLIHDPRVVDHKDPLGG